MYSALFINIKKWLQLYGSDVLDLFIQVDHPEELDPRNRYDNFDEQFNNHVGTSEHYQVNQGVEFPFLAIDIACDNKVNCFSRFKVTFTVYFSPVTPITGRYCVENTPEGKLEYLEEVYCAIHNMLSHTVETPKGFVTKTFADDLVSLDGWKWKIRGQLVDKTCPSEIRNEYTDEVESFDFSVDLSLYTCL